jgi:hypothetical protein
MHRPGVEAVGGLASDGVSEVSLKLLLRRLVLTSPALHALSQIVEQALGGS